MSGSRRKSLFTGLGRVTPTKDLQDWDGLEMFSYELQSNPARQLRKTLGWSNGRVSRRYVPNVGWRGIGCSCCYYSGRDWTIKRWQKYLSKVLTLRSHREGTAQALKRLRIRGLRRHVTY